MVTLGRQEINLDDRRVVGAAGFRQNEQTFDAIRIDNGAVPGLSLTYIYLDRINRVFGERSSQSHYNGDVHLLNAGSDAYGKLDLTKRISLLERSPERL